MGSYDLHAALSKLDSDIRTKLAAHGFSPERLERFGATLTEGDPTPFRNTIYGLHVDRVAGRMAEQRRRLPKHGARHLDTAPSPPPRPENPDGF